MCQRGGRKRHRKCGNDRRGERSTLRRKLSPPDTRQTYIGKATNGAGQVMPAYQKPNASPNAPSAGTMIAWPAAARGRLKTQAKPPVIVAIETMVIGANTAKRRGRSQLAR